MLEAADATETARTFADGDPLYSDCVLGVLVVALVLLPDAEVLLLRSPARERTKVGVPSGSRRR